MKREIVSRRCNGATPNATLAAYSLSFMSTSSIQHLHPTLPPSVLWTGREQCSVVFVLAQATLLEATADSGSSLTLARLPSPW